MRINTLKTIEAMRGNVNPRYDLSLQSLKDIGEISTGTYDLAYKSFQFGYAQGMKAAKAEMKGVR